MVLVTTVAKQRSVVVHLCTVVGNILVDHLDKEEPGILAWRPGLKKDPFPDTVPFSLEVSAPCTTSLQLPSPRTGLLTKGLLAAGTGPVS